MEENKVEIVEEESKEIEKIENEMKVKKSLKLQQKNQKKLKNLTFLKEFLISKILQKKK